MSGPVLHSTLLLDFIQPFYPQPQLAVVSSVKVLCEREGKKKSASLRLEGVSTLATLVISAFFSYLTRFDSSSNFSLRHSSHLARLARVSHGEVQE